MSSERPKVLCAVQSDDLAPSVVATATRFAEVGGYEVHFLHAADLPSRTPAIYPLATGTPAYSRQAVVRQFMAAGRELFERLGLEPGSAGVVLGDPIRVIAAKAKEMEPDFIVLGSRGHGALAGAILGSVTRGLADLRRWPLLVVSDSNNAASHGAVVCGVTAPLEDAVLAARSAERLARRLRKPLILGHVPKEEEDSERRFESGGFLSAPGASLPAVVVSRAEESRAARFLDAVASRLEGAVDLRKEILSGSPATALIELAAEEGAEAIVVGRRAIGAMRSAIRGSVSLDVIRDADCPVMVVPGTAGV